VLAIGSGYVTETNRWLEHLFSEITQLRWRCGRLFDELTGDRSVRLDAGSRCCAPDDGVVVRVDLPRVRRKGRPG
jgi:hypothetical protein